jgi:2-polyprenyl-3-methyl-5-hydroxy-6-metoxy-1,4-benzoquinol methylase
MVINDIENIEPGFYAKKVLLTKFWPVRFSHSSRFQYGIKLVSKYNPKIVIDYGCGDGTLLSFIHNKIEKSIGLEAENHVVEDLKKRFSSIRNIEFYTIEQFEYAKNLKADLLFCTEVFEHAVDIPMVIEHLKKYVSDNGLIIVSVPNEIGFMLIIKYLIRKAGACFNVSNYREYENYSFKEFVYMLFAGRNTKINRKIYCNSYRTHKGFNWKYFKAKYIDNNFFIFNITGTPFPFLFTFLNSQIWFVLKIKQ